MSRIRDTFHALKQDGRGAFIPYIMAGDPTPGKTVELMHALVEGGADIIELGFPFSDPTADGPVIQAAGERALTSGMTLSGVLEVCRHFRETDATTPIILMGYANPVMRFGYEAFAASLEAEGVDGVIIVDLPPEEENELLAALNPVGVAMIRLVAPTTDGERLERLLHNASGFVYTISVKGITGGASSDTASLQHRIKEIRQHTDLPAVIGFGIKTADDVKALAPIADGVVVGSSLVQTLYETQQRGGDIISVARDMTTSLSAPMRCVV